MQPDISIIIVNYNGGELLFNCLNSIFSNITLNYQVVVVDNASTDNSLSRCECFKSDDRFEFVLLEENVGFSKGNNIGAKRGKGRIFHFLNPDTELSKEMNSDYFQAVANPEKVYVNPLRNMDGSFEDTKKVIPTMKNIFLWTFARKRAWFWCLGASVIISRDNFEKLGGWSEDYFIYSEDLDLFYRIRLSGIEIRIMEVPVFHLKGGTTVKKWSSLEREINVQRSFRIFYKKYFSRGEYIMVKLYFILHDLIKRPSVTGRSIRAWKAVANEDKNIWK